MALVSSKHKLEDTISFSDLTGGVNYSISPDDISENELSGALNFFYDPNTFRLMNRPGVARYSVNGEPSGNPINGGFYSSVLALDFVASNGVLYKLDSSKTLVSIGSLNGSGMPSFLDFNGKVLVACGGVIQSTDGSTIANVANAPVSGKIMAYMGRVLSAGSTTYPHRLFLSAPGDETDWDSVSGSGLYFDVALNVGDKIVDFNVFGNDIIIFKGIQEKGIYRLVLPEVVSGTGFDAAYIKEESKINSSVNFNASMQEGNDLLFLDNNGVKSIVATQKYGDIEQDESGRKINSVITPYIDKDYAFMVRNPYYSQVWIKYAASETIYVFHYLLKAFLPLEFVGLKMYSGWYHEEDRIFLIGMDDGYVYKLDKNVFTDNGTDVPAYIYTRRFRTLTNLKTLGNLFRKLLKQTTVDYERVAAGSESLQIEIDGGSNTINLITFSLSSGFDLLYEATGLLYNATGLLYGSNYAVENVSKLVNFYDARLLLAIASGAVKLNRIECRIAISGRR